ncbi:acetylornithine deacetylase [Paralimibaculum aggregatum]|uniref:Acetylornithine deacetylase n=1 Tax=Paralimibaculum aggregatum TaxID=3036245 RepID=A0ABQ6LIE1_9RHOB|nr:acetylornithine deacetylase [Limibaculum sp. NKW23]GMG83055.1 acetylornithine deacetylase [Limibaculum sp. NKW23]
MTIPITARAAPGAAQILGDLVAIPDLPGRSNAAMAGCVRARLAAASIDCHVLPGPEGDRVNLFASIGPRDVPGVILSGHMDVVPAEGQPWTSDPFCLTQREGRLVGRGASDMKGFLACMIAMAPTLASMGLARPVHLAFSYDEEIGCQGVGHMIARLPELCAPPSACIVGEPSGLAPVLAHKGKQAFAVEITGRAAHSSEPAKGINALYPAARLLAAMESRAAALAEEGARDARFAPAHSTLVAGTIHGGVALNIIPERAVIEGEVRAIPAEDPREIAASLLARAEALETEYPGISVSHRMLGGYPALPFPDDPGLSRLMERLTGRPAAGSVSYGTEAGLFHAAGIPSIICGPGSIDRAHRADEYILPGELDACCAMIRALGETLTG